MKARSLCSGALFFSTDKTTGIAFAFILKGKVQQHRQWITRSYAVALVLLEDRVILGVTGWENIPEVGEVVVWTSVGLSLLLADIVLQLQELYRTRPLAPQSTTAPH